MQNLLSEWMFPTSSEKVFQRARLVLPGGGQEYCSLVLSFLAVSGTRLSPRVAHLKYVEPVALSS